ncbi:DNA repair protein RecO [Methyloligella solikamskensis]|uniref:DNA repair protein RecO n=1 Tax=Methyloligella solikamskensis TaxID=1177756 RepID=A0ABW3JBT2_9HYPH
MDWRDDGILLSTRPLGEANAIAELLTEEHGRHLGLVRGGRSRRLRPLLQPSNLLHITWRARLPEHLGSITVELMQAYAAGVLDDHAALLGIESLTSMARMLPERDPHPALYHGARAVLETLDDPKVWPARLVRWELEFLADMGFGIDLSECAATGTMEDLIFVSPKSGRAVSKEAGEPYADKLFRLPAFLIDEEATASPEDIADGFRLSGYFLDRDLYSPQGEPLPAARERLLARL